MNTKTSYKYGHKFYDGSDHAPGKDGPGALLDMLAEVASRTLRSESACFEMDTATKSKRKSDSDEELSPYLPRVLSMPPTQLVKHFAIFSSDELKRRYSYECALVPGCRQKYTSFASESRARVSITTHLICHLDRFRDDKDSRDYGGMSKTVACKRVKRPRVGRNKTIQEIPNKETKLVEKSTSYLRNILSNDMDFEKFEKEKKTDIKVKKEPDSEVLSDHSYCERAIDQTILDSGMHEGDPFMTENIMLMVVESDRVCVKELPRGINDDSNVQRTNQGSNSMDRNNCESNTPAKPKGKAKFIGTSKEEREMALVLMERIKKKGNPTGSNLQCRICDPPRSFTAPTTLVSHYRSHAGIKPYECRICRSVFTRRHSLKYHMLIHQNQTRFTCADCGKKFRHPSHFREHRRRHTGESPFGCEDCGQRFKTRNTYKRHLKTRHGKVLTTSGELLCLTEEEFEKVHTNRKRKIRLIENSTSSVGRTVDLVDGYEVFPRMNDDPKEKIIVNKGDNEETENARFSNDYDESGNDRIIYDGRVIVEDEDDDEELVNSTIRIHHDYDAIKDENKNPSNLVVVVDENNEFVVPYEAAPDTMEYYENGEIMDQEIVQFPDNLPETETIKMKENTGGYRVSNVDKKNHVQCPGNNPLNDCTNINETSLSCNNNNNNYDNNNEFDDNSVFIEETRESNEGVIQRDDFKTNYLGIENDGVLEFQERSFKDIA